MSRRSWLKDRTDHSAKLEQEVPRQAGNRALLTDGVSEVAWNAAGTASATC